MVLLIVCFWLLGFIFNIEILSFIAFCAIIATVLLPMPLDMLRISINNVKKSKDNDLKSDSNTTKESTNKSNIFFNFSIIFLFFPVILHSLFLLFHLLSKFDSNSNYSAVGYIAYFFHMLTPIFSYLSYFLCYVFLKISSKKNEIKTLQKSKFFLETFIMSLIFSITLEIIIYGYTIYSK